MHWSAFEAATPTLAAFARERFTAHRRRILAILRREGAQRISGTETIFHSGELG